MEFIFGIDYKYTERELRGQISPTAAVAALECGGTTPLWSAVARHRSNMECDSTTLLLLP